MPKSNAERQLAFRRRGLRARKEALANYESLKFFCAILLAVSEHRAKSLEVMEDFIANLKNAPTP